MSQELRTASTTEYVPGRPRAPSDAARVMIFKYQGASLVFLILGFVFTLLGAIFAPIFLWGLPVDLTLAVSGREVQASPLQVDERTDVTLVVNGRRRALYEIRYAYELDGERFEGRGTTTDSAIISAAEREQPFLVEASGSWSRIKGGTYNLFGYIPVFVLIFPLVGLGFLVVAIRVNRRQRYVYINGLPTIARIISSGPNRSVKLNGRHPHQISWSFEYRGQHYQGDLSAMNGLQSIQVAQPVVVLFDPERPKHSTLYLP